MAQPEVIPALPPVECCLSGLSRWVLQVGFLWVQPMLWAVEQLAVPVWAGRGAGKVPWNGPHKRDTVPYTRLCAMASWTSAG